MVCAAAITLCVHVSLFAIVFCQSANASFSGRVNDTARAVAGCAKIAAVSAGTNLRYETRTNGSGEYTQVNIFPAIYRMEVEKAGFKKLIKPDVLLQIQGPVLIDFALALGPFPEGSAAEAGAPLINTESGTVSTVVDSALAAWGAAETELILSMSFPDELKRRIN
jgi:hypothetical protein